MTDTKFRRDFLRKCPTCLVAYWSPRFVYCQISWLVHVPFLLVSLGCFTRLSFCLHLHSHASDGIIQSRLKLYWIATIRRNNRFDISLVTVVLTNTKEDIALAIARL